MSYAKCQPFYSFINALLVLVLLSVLAEPPGNLRNAYFTIHLSVLEISREVMRIYTASHSVVSQAFS